MRKLTLFICLFLLSSFALARPLTPRYLPVISTNAYFFQTVPVGRIPSATGTLSGSCAPNNIIRVDGTNAAKMCLNGTWRTLSTGSSSITINGLTNTSFTLAVGTAGSDFAVANAGSTVTFNLPDASASARGLVVTGAQTFGGQKVFQAQSSSDVPLVLQGASGQSGDLLQFKSFNNLVLGRMDNTGSFVFNNGTVNAGIKFKDSGGNTILAHQLYGDDYYWDNTTASGSLNIRTGGTNLRLSISSAGLFTYCNGCNFAFNTSTGTKIGTAATQKLAFWNATPIVQPSGTGETVGFTAGSGTAVKDDSCFTGNLGSTCYRINDVVKAAKQLGLLAQ